MPSGWADENWLDTATSVTCHGEVAGLPASRLQIDRVSRRFRVDGLTSGDTTREVRIDFGQSRPIDRSIWVRVRRNGKLEARDGPVFAASDLVRHKLSSSNAHTGDIYDSGWIPSNIINGYGYHDHIVPLDGDNAVRTAQYASFVFNALSRTGEGRNYVDWGRAAYLKLSTVAIGYRAPFAFGWRDAGTATRSADGGSEIVNDRTKGYRVLSVPFASVKMIERNDVLDFMERTRTTGRFFFVGDTAVADPRHCLIARNLTPDLDQTSRAFNRFEMSLIESL